MPVYVYPINTTGSAGSATGSVTTDIDFPAIVIDCISVSYNASAPSTTDLTVEEAEGLGRTILSLANRNTGIVVYPRHTLHDTSGTEDASQLDAFIAHGPLKITVSQCNALTPAATVKIAGWIPNTLA